MDPKTKTGSSDDLTATILGIIPKRATWQQNGLRAADQLSGKIRWVDCPMHPVTMRAIAVSYYLGTVSASDYRNGVAGATRTGTQGQPNHTEPLNLIPDEYVDALGQQRTNLRFQGFCDKWRVVRDDDGESVIEFECRDNTQMFIDTEAPPGIAISVKKPLDQAIAEYLTNFPAFNGIAVEYRPAGVAPPIVSSALAGTAYQPELGPTPAQGGAAVHKMSVWDYLTDITGAVAHTVRIEGITLVIQQVVTLLSSSTARRTDDPFQGRTVDGVTFNYRRFIWGRNIRKYSLERNYNKHAPTNIEVRCYSQRRKKDLVARFPDVLQAKSKLQIRPRPGDGAIKQNWKVVKIKGVEDQATLFLIAQNIYQSIGRNELQLSIGTKNVSSFGAGGINPDILDMRVGDTFEELVRVSDEQDFVGTIKATTGILKARASDFMQRLGFSQDLADKYATAYTASGFQTTFRLRAMSVDWNCDGDGDDAGVSIDLHAANYIEVRVDQPFKGT